jgi:hypothetical protein
MKNLFLIFFLIPYIFIGQINFDKVPENFQLFPRDENNDSHVVFSGYGFLSWTHESKKGGSCYL